MYVGCMCPVDTAKNEFLLFAAVRQLRTYVAVDPMLVPLYTAVHIVGIMYKLGH